MSRKSYALVFLAVVLLVLAGCGSGGSGGSYSGTADDTLENAATVGINNCLTCHSPASELVKDWSESLHANRLILGAKAGGEQDVNDTRATVADPRPGTCAYCHDPLGDGDEIDLVLMQTFEDDTVTDWSQSGSIVGCEACHGGGQFHNGQASGIPYATPGPEQCGQCHYLNADIDNDEWAADGEYPHHTTSSSGNNVRRNVTDTHVDDPATSYEVANAAAVCDDDDAAYDEAACEQLNIVEGYAIRYDNQGGCVDCHFGGHEMDLSINYEWATSGHAGKIKVAKDAALVAGAADAATLLANVTAAGPSGDDYAWGHYTWDSDNRASCQMCHTTTGFMNYATDPEAYNAAIEAYDASEDPADLPNDFSHLVGWTSTTRESGQNELLYCWGCHSDSDGNLRMSGAVTASYTYGGSDIVFPDIGASNTCVVCHSGRNNNEIVSTSSRFAGHHAPTAAILFSEFSHVAYEYDADGDPATNDYANPVYFAHDSIDEDGQGACVACHMNGEDIDHTFNVVEKDGAGVITSINAEVCVSCHDGEHGDPLVTQSMLGTDQDIWDGAAVVPTNVTQIMIDDAALFLEHESEAYQQAGQVAQDLLKNANGLQNYLTVAAGSDVVISNSLADAEDNDLGAFQNAKLPAEDPGGFAHNRFYVKRALFDAIDWLEDGSLDGTIEDYTAFDGVNYSGVTAWLGVARP